MSTWFRAVVVFALALACARDEIDGRGDLSRVEFDRGDALSSLTAHPERTIPALIEILRTDVALRDRSIYVLGEAGSTDERVLDALSEVVAADRGNSRYLAATALAKLRSKRRGYVPWLLLARRRAKPLAARWDAMRVVDAVKVEIAPQAVFALRHDLAEVRLRAFELLMYVDERALRPLVGALERLAADPPAVRGPSAVLRARVAPADPELLTGLRIAASLDESEYATAAVETLRRFDARDDQTVDMLLWALVEAKSPHVRGLAATVLGDWESDPEKTVPALIALVRTDRTSARESAAYALTRFSDASHRSVPVLVAALHEQHEFRLRGRVQQCTGRRWAATALGFLRAESAVADLIRALEYDSVGTWSEAIVALGRIGPAAAAAVPELVRAIEQHSEPGGEWSLARVREYDDGKVRRKAIEALGRIGPRASIALPTLRRLASEGNQEARAAIAAIED